MTTFTLPIEADAFFFYNPSDGFRTQVFTPSGRYGISIECPSYAGWTSYNKITVMDLAEMKLHFYKKEQDLPKLPYDLHYCLNEFQLALLRYDFFGSGFTQEIIQLNHKEKSFEIIKTRSFFMPPHIDRRCLGLHQHGDTITINYDGEDFIVWITDPVIRQNDGSCFSRLCLIPKDPNSQTNMRMFYIEMYKLVNKDNEVVKYYEDKYNRRCFTYGTPVVIDGKLCLTVVRDYETTIMNVYQVIDIKKLINIFENQNINMEEITEKQRSAYSIISIPRGDGDIESSWPAYETEFYSNGNTFYQWVKKTNSNSTNENNFYNRGSTLIVNGKPQIFDFEFPEEQRYFYYTIHPCGFRLRWSNMTRDSVDLKIENIGGSVGSLFNLVKKKLFVEDLIKNIKDPAVLEIFWEKI